jgi:hypothetical protein
MKATIGQKIVVTKGLPSDGFVNGRKVCGLTPVGSFRVHAVNPYNRAVCLVPSDQSITNDNGSFYWIQNHNMPH